MALSVIRVRLFRRESLEGDHVVTPPLRLVQIALFVAAVVGVFMATVAARLVGPTVHPDEFGFLINGQVIIGRDEAAIPTGSFYPAGYGLFTGLGHLLTGTMGGAYTFSLFFNLALSVVLAWVAMRLAVQGFGASRQMGWIAGALVFVVPGTAVSAMFSWVETAARLAFLVFVALVLRASRALTHRDFLVLSIFVGLMPALHGRFTLLIPVTGLFLLWSVWRKHVTRGLGFLSIFVMSVGYAGSYILNTFVKNAVYTTSYDQEDRLLERLFDPALWPALLRTMVGQSWYLLATTFGLVGVAVFFVASSSRQAWSAEKKELTPELQAMVVMMLGTFAVIFTGGLQLLHGNRGDHLIYGRYVEMMVPALLVVACVAYERSFIRTQRAILLSAVVGLVVAVLYVVIDQQDGVRDGHFRDTIVFANIVGFDFAKYLVTPGLISFGLLFCMGTVVFWGLLRRFGAVGLMGVIFFFAVASVYSGQNSILSRTEVLEQSGVSVDYVKNGESELVGFDEGVRNDRAYYYMRFLLHPIDVEMFDISSPQAQIPVDYSCLYGWADRPPVDGAWGIVAEEPALGRVLWQRVGTTSC